MKKYHLIKVTFKPVESGVKIIAYSEHYKRRLNFISSVWRGESIAFRTPLDKAAKQLEMLGINIIGNADTRSGTDEIFFISDTFE